MPLSMIYGTTYASTGTSTSPKVHIIPLTNDLKLRNAQTNQFYDALESKIRLTNWIYCENHNHFYYKDTKTKTNQKATSEAKMR